MIFFITILSLYFSHALAHTLTLGLHNIYTSFLGFLFRAEYLTAMSTLYIILGLGVFSLAYGEFNILLSNVFRSNCSSVQIYLSELSV